MRAVIPYTYIIINKNAVNAVFNSEMFAMILVWTITRNYVITSSASVVYVFYCHHCCLLLSSLWCCSLFYCYLVCVFTRIGIEGTHFLSNNTLCHQSCDHTFSGGGCNFWISRELFWLCVMLLGRNWQAIRMYY